MTELLALQAVSKSFGALAVARDLEFTLAEGEALGVIGPNGAGKTTMFNLVSGVLAADRGRLRFRGRDITRLSARRRCLLGIGRTFQVPQPFEGMSVFENLLVAATFARADGLGAADERAWQVLVLTGLAAKANRRAGALNLLDRKRLELARALAGEPRLLLLDEIAGGLTEGECRELVDLVRSIRAAGIAVIWIEHVVHALLAAVDRLLVLDQGALVAEGDPETVMASAVVRTAYLGIDADAG